MEEQNNQNKLEGAKILWVEDDDFLAGMIAKKLASLGVEFKRDQDGESALKSLEEYAPNVVVLDIMLPNMSGLEVLKRIKENPQTKDIPVIMLSNLSQNDDVSKVLELGASKFFVKASMTLDEIIAEIENLLKR